MASFLEKYPSITRREYIYKLTVPQITMMLCDAPKTLYGKGRIIHRRIEEKSIAAKLNRQVTGEGKTLSEIFGKNINFNRKDNE